MMATGAAHDDRAGRRLHAQGRRGRRARAGRDRLHHRRHQDRRRLPGRRHDHRGPPPGRRAAARLQAGAAGGVLRPVPDRRRRLRAAARQPRQAAPQRCQLRIRAGDLGGAGLRLPLRLSRPAASGDHPGAAGARVRSRPDHHRALGRLSRAPDQRRGAASCTTRPTCPTRCRIDHIEEPWIKATILVPDDYLGRSWRSARSGAACRRT